MRSIVPKRAATMARCDAQEVAEAASPIANAKPRTSTSRVSALRASPTAIDVTARATAHVGQAAPRAKQKISPAARRAVLQRDEHRCRTPGCKHTSFLDLHHIVPRSEGGPNHADNLLTLCGAHHRAVHHGELVIAGDTAISVRFRHADGRDYGDVSNPNALDVHARVFAGLRGLGFRESEARAALSELARGDGETPSAETLLRESLQRLTPDRVQS